MSSLMFSFVIPAYGVGDYVGEALASLRGQEECGWEAVCVDDGSRDGTGRILDEEARADARIRVIHQRNGGVSAARNRALQWVRGLWVAFLDADDVLHPRMLATIHKVLDEQPKVEMVTFGHVYAETPHFSDAETWSKPEWQLVDMSQRIWGSIARTGLWEAVYRRSLVAQFRFEPMVVGEDRLYVVEAVCRARKVIQLSCPFYGYRKRHGSAILSPWTVRKVQDEFLSGVAMLQCYCRSGRIVDVGLIRGECVRVVERFSFLMSALANGPEKQRLYQTAFIVYRTLAHERKLSCWFRVVFGVAGRLRSVWFLWLVGELPFRLKLWRNRLRGA